MRAQGQRAERLARQSGLRRLGLDVIAVADDVTRAQASLAEAIAGGASRTAGEAHVDPAVDAAVDGVKMMDAALAKATI